MPPAPQSQLGDLVMNRVLAKKMFVAATKSYTSF